MIVKLGKHVGTFKGSSEGQTTFVGTLGGASPTVIAGDTLIGYGVGNVFDVTATDDDVMPTIGVSGIQTLDLSSNEGFTLDATKWVGLSTLDVAASDGDDEITAGSKTAVLVNDNGDRDIVVNGGLNVTINNNPKSGTFGNHVQVNGGAGTKSVSINNGFDGVNDIYDLNNGTGKKNTIASVSIKNEVDYETYIYSDALSSLKLTGISNTLVCDYASASRKSVVVTLNNDGNASGGGYWFLVEGNPTGITVDSVEVASNNLYFFAPNATSLVFDDAVGLSFYDGASSGSEYFEDGSAAKVTIAGAGAFTADLSGASTKIKAQSSSGAITLEMASASGGSGAQSFTGGSGLDVITIGGGQTGAITGSANVGNEILLRNVSNASSADIAATLVTGFSVLGVTGSTDGDFDLSHLASYHAFDVQSADGDLTFSNVTLGSRLSVDYSDPGAITVQDKAAYAGVFELDLGTASTSGISAPDIELRNIGTVSIVSNGSGVNAIDELGGAITTIDLSGAAGIALDDLPANGLAIKGAADSANVSITLGDSSNTLSLGGGTDSVSVGQGHNVISYGAHAGKVDTTSVGANGSLTTLTTIAGALTTDQLVIADANAFDTTEIASAQVMAVAGGVNSLTDWVDGALSASGDKLAQHHAAWFQFQGDTFVVEQAGVTGTNFGVGDTLVELKGLLNLSSATYMGSGKITL